MMLFKNPVPSRQNVSWKILIALSFFGSLGVLSAQPSAEGTMPEDYLPGLKPILQAALKRSPQMILSEISIVQAESTRMTTDSQRYPNLGGSIQYTNGSSASSGTGSIPNQGLQYNLGISQSLFQFGAIKNQSEIARIGVLVAEKNHAEAYRLFALNLRQQYLALVVKKASIAAAYFRVKISEAALETEEQKLKNGAISQGELISPRLALDEARVTVARAEQDYANSLQVFAHLAGAADLDDSMIPKEIAKPKYSADTAASFVALLQRDNAEGTFQSQVAALHVRESDLTYKIARVRLLPKIYFNAGVTQSNSTSVLPATAATAKTVSTSAVSTQSGSVVAVWTLFDGFATRAAKLSALTTKRYYETALQTQIRTTLDTAQNAEKMLAISARSLDLTEQRAQLAEATLNKVKEDFKISRATQSAVDETTVSYLINQGVLASARAEFFRQWSEYVSLVGADPAMNNLPTHHGR